VLTTKVHIMVHALLLIVLKCVLAVPVHSHHIKIKKFIQSTYKDRSKLLYINQPFRNVLFEPLSCSL